MACLFLFSYMLFQSQIDATSLERSMSSINPSKSVNEFFLPRNYEINRKKNLFALELIFVREDGPGRVSIRIGIDIDHSPSMSRSVLSHSCFCFFFKLIWCFLFYAKRTDVSPISSRSSLEQWLVSNAPNSVAKSLVGHAVLRHWEKTSTCLLFFARWTPKTTGRTSSRTEHTPCGQSHRQWWCTETGQDP